MRETPTIASVTSNTSAFQLGPAALNNLAAQAAFAGDGREHLAKIYAQANQQFEPQKQPIPQTEKPAMAANPRRLVQVFIADPNENVPLEQSLLYSGEQKLTDLTDQELFFDIDIKTLLDKHNEARVKLVNKAVKERTEHLEPARIRDLKMSVVNIATF